MCNSIKTHLQWCCRNPICFWSYIARKFQKNGRLHNWHVSDSDQSQVYLYKERFWKPNLQITVVWIQVYAPLLVLNKMIITSALFTPMSQSTKLPSSPADISWFEDGKNLMKVTFCRCPWSSYTVPFLPPISHTNTTAS